VGAAQADGVGSGRAASDDDYDEFSRWMLVLAYAVPGRAAAATSAQTYSGVFRLANFSGSLEAGEPTLGGLMKKTVWARLLVPGPKRVIVHTFGSDFDTVLAAYRGNTLTSLVGLAANDNKSVPGMNGIHSLIQFNAAAGVPYRIQIGSKTGAEGDIVAAFFAFPPTGGLSAFLGTVGGNARHGRDFACRFGAGLLDPCGNATFILHNSTARTMTVTPTHSLGAGLASPAPFALAPGQVKTATFTSPRPSTKPLPARFPAPSSSLGAAVEMWSAQPSIAR
jgi:hypothetical protein